MLRKAVSTILALAAGTAALAQLNYAQRNVAIRAGVVVIDSQQLGGGERANYNPYVWFNLDSNKKLLPAGWSFYNPQASTQVTQAIATRWLNHNTQLGLGAVGPAVGDLITKRDAPYWEVFLSTASDAQITSYDVLSLSAYGLVRLNSLEREKLRKFMESGGVLWVDTRNLAQFDAANGLPIPFAISNTNLGTPATGDFKHPLLSVPNAVGFDSLFAMQSENTVGLRPMDLAALGYGNLQGIEGGTRSDFDKLLPVASDALGPAVMVGQVGSGYLVVTSRAVAATLNRTQVGGALNTNQFHRAYSPLFDRGSDAAAKLVVNMVNLTSGHSQNGKGARKVNSSPIDIGAPLLKRFEGAASPTNDIHFYNPPVLFNGMAILVTGDQILVYDANPGTDLDGDGNPDDGVPDFALGGTEDLIWASQPMGALLSAPACAEVPDAASAPAQQIAVTDERGRLLIFNAFPPVPGLAIPPSAVVPAPPGSSSADTSLEGHGPYAPTYHDGLIFVSDEASAGLGGIVGRVWIADSRTGAPVITNTNWLAGGSSSPTLPRPSGSPVVGYIPIADNSGGLDRVVYVAGRPNPSGGPFATAGISSIWLGVRGEKPTAVNAIPGLMTVTTRAAGQGLRVYNPQPADTSPLGVKMTLVDGAGNPLPDATLNAWFDGTINQGADGILSFGLTATGTANLAAIQASGVRLDYTIDWGTNNPGQTSQLLRGQIFMPDDGSPLNAANRRRILHNLALSPEGTIHLVHGFQPPALPAAQNANQQGGAFYSLREEGRGAFKLLNRYELYGTHTFLLNQAGTATVRETLQDTDELQQFVPAFLSGNFSNLSFQGGPSIHNGVVYVTARGYKNIFVPCTIVLAFQAEPDIPQIYVGDISGSFSLLQPDLARSSNKSQPENYSTLQPTQFVYERQPGSDRGTIRLDNLMASTRGPMQNAISRSQPIILRRSGQPDQLIEPDRSGSRWNPLLWYYVSYGVSNASPPTVTGNTLFFAGSSSLPSILESGAILPTRGLLTGIDADISPTDPFLVSNPVKPWQKQLWNLKLVSLPDDIRPNPAVRWPQSSGVTSFQSWAVRLLQTTLGDAPNAFGVVAGDGVLLSWSPPSTLPGSSGKGLFGFSRADFLVADEGRLSRFDPSGNPIWSSDASLITGPSGDTGSAANVKPLVRPTRAYPLSQTDMIVVDTGSDRVVRMDTGGRELRSIDRFTVDTNFVPDGFSTNEPLTLNAPRDVMTFATYETASGFSNAAPLEYWIHYVIADSGNKRILELVDRYAANPATRRIEGVITDGSGNKALGVLLWHSPSSFSGKNFSYNSIARVYIEAGPASRWVYAAGIGSALPTRVDTGLDAPSAAKPREAEGGNGGIVVFDGSNSQIIDAVEVPAIGANILYNPVTGLFDAPARAARIGDGMKKLGNLTSVTMRNVLINGVSRVAIMFCDSEGVFEIAQPNAGGPWQVIWMLPNEVYTVMRRDSGTNAVYPTNPRQLRANYARRLDSGEVLIVNGYTGRTRGGAAFDGEVIEVVGNLDQVNTPTSLGYNLAKTNLGFRTFSVRFELPPVQGARGILIPVFADRR